MINRIPLFVTLAVLLLINGVFVGVGLEKASGLPSYTMDGAAIGFFFGQLVPVAAWLALAETNWVFRWVYSLLAVAFVISMVFLFLQEVRAEIILVFAGAIFSQFFIYQIPLWPARWRAWRLRWGIEDATVDQNDQATQFGLRQMFFWTTAVAILATIYRSIASFFQQSGSAGREDFSIFLLLALGNGLAMLPVIWAAFVRDHRVAWWIGSVVWCFGIGVVEIFLLNQLGIILMLELYLFSFINVAQFVVATILLQVMRLTGARVHRLAGTAQR